MAHYVAIIEENGPEDISLWFPDLPGCMSGGDDVDEALENAPEIIAFYAEELAGEGRQLPSPRTLDELKADPEFADDLRNHTAVLIEFPPSDDAQD